MLAIMAKDIIENVKPLLLFTVLPVVFVILVLYRPVSPGKMQQLEGFVQALPLACGFIFVHTVILNERKRRHIILLKSLPIAVWEILLAKFLAILALVSSITNAPQLILCWFGHGPGFGSLVLLNAVVTLYVFVLSFCTIAFENPALIALPMYLAVGILVFEPDMKGLPRLWHRLVGLMDFPVIVVLVCAIGSACFYLLALIVFKRKELDF